jgi:hypothetical protein
VNTFGAKCKASWSFSILAILGLWAPATAAADWVLAERSSWMGPTGLALGGALAAHLGRSDYIYANPAAPAFEQKYTVGLSYMTAGDQLRAQVVDTKSSALGGGISFTQRNVEEVGVLNDGAFGNFNRLEHSAVASLMTQISPTVAIGISGHHRYIRPQGTPLPATSFWSGDLGVMVKIDPKWTLGLAGLDMIADSTGYTVRTLSVGVAGNHIVAGLTLLGQMDFVRAPEGSGDTGFCGGRSCGFDGPSRRIPDHSRDASAGFLLRPSCLATELCRVGTELCSRNLLFGIRSAPRSEQRQGSVSLSWSQC